MFVLLIKIFTAALHITVYCLWYWLLTVNSHNDGNISQMLTKHTYRCSVHKGNTTLKKINNMLIEFLNFGIFYELSLFVDFLKKAKEKEIVIIFLRIALVKNKNKSEIFPMANIIIFFFHSYLYVVGIFSLFKCKKKILNLSL